jgi:nucleotide-binding universal stress UspA family protein
MQIQKILCPTDFSILSERGVELAARIAQRLDGCLTLQHNLEPLSPLYMTGLEALPQSIVELEAEREKDAERRLRELADSVSPATRVRGRITSGQTDAAILELAETLPADLIVLGTHGRSGLGHLFLGSVTERVIAQARCPVLAVRDGSRSTEPDRFLVKGTEAGSTIPVLVPIDFSAHSLYTLEYAFRLRELLPISLVLLHVLEPVSIDDLRSATHLDAAEILRLRRREFRDRLRGLLPANREGQVDVTVSVGLPAEEILRAAAKIQAAWILMGNRSKSFVDELLGTTSKGVLRASACPVWIVPDHVAQSSLVEAAATVH